MKSKAIYPGSFDPFTNGHLDIVKKSAELFGEVYVVIGVNANKRRAFDPAKMTKAIEATVKSLGITNVKVAAYEGLVAEYAKTNGIKYMIRGLRNNMDYNYEENIAQVNQLINPGLETIYLRADEAVVSSSMIRELMAFGKPVDRFVPPAVRELLGKE